MWISLITTVSQIYITASSVFERQIFSLTGAVVGFQPVDYEVNENEGSVTLTVLLLDGVLEREVTVFFETSPGTATSAGTPN